MRVAHDLDLEGEVLGPVHPAARRHVPRVAVVLETAEETVELGREARLDEHLVAAHVGDVVDVLDVDRALVDARAAVRARPQHVGVDDRAAAGLPRHTLGLAHERALGLGHDRWIERAALVLGSQVVRRCGERVVPQVHDQHLGRQRLLGVPGRALRLAATALGAGREVEDALPREVVDRADAEGGVLVEVVDVVEGDRLAVVHHRLHRTQRDRALVVSAGRRVGTLEHDVERRDEDVQVLGVQHER